MWRELRLWGAANDLTICFEEPTLIRIFDDAARTCRGRIPSGGKKEVLSLRIDSAGPGMMETLPAYPPNGCLGPIQARWTCKDDLGASRSGTAEVSFYDRCIYLTQNGFRVPPRKGPEGAAIAMPSDITYIVVLDADAGAQERVYEMSRKIPPGDVERFHIMIGANKTCTLELRFGFFIDNDKIIKSDPFHIHIWNPAGRVRRVSTRTAINWPDWTLTKDT